MCWSDWSFLGKEQLDKVYVLPEGPRMDAHGQIDYNFGFQTFQTKFILIFKINDDCSLGKKGRGGSQATALASTRGQTLSPGARPCVSTTVDTLLYLFN
jgi:hypothetical protein